MLGDQGVYEAVHAIIPAELFLSHLPKAGNFPWPFEIKPALRLITDGSLDLLSCEGDHCSSTLSEALVVALLEAVSDTITPMLDGRTRRQRVSDERMTEVEIYIRNNLTDPNLTYEGVAKKCGLSPRYLSYILNANDTSFSHLLWGQRLLKARDWLITPAFQSYLVHEIAFMAGFKSAAHFSRLFKVAFGKSPKEYRLHGTRVLPSHTSGLTTG